MILVGEIIAEKIASLNYKVEHFPSLSHHFN